MPCHAPNPLRHWPRRSPRKRPLLWSRRRWFHRGCSCCPPDVPQHGSTMVWWRCFIIWKFTDPPDKIMTCMYSWHLFWHLKKKVTYILTFSLTLILAVSHFSIYSDMLASILPLALAKFMIYILTYCRSTQIKSMGFPTWQEKRRLRQFRPLLNYAKAMVPFNRRRGTHPWSRMSTGSSVEKSSASAEGSFFPVLGLLEI